MDIPIYGFRPTAILCGFLLLLGCWIPQLCAAQTITLAWDPGAAPDIAGYRLYSGTASGVYTKVTEVGNATTTAVSNLGAGTTYFFAVTAYNTAGLESPPSNQISYTVPLSSPTPTPIPTPPPALGQAPFKLDGQPDSSGYLQYSSGMIIYAAVRGQTLYVATWSPGSSGGQNDHFIFVTDQLLSGASAPAPWAKAGNVAMAGNKPFIGAEGTTAYCGWFNAPPPPTAQVAKAATNSGLMEGTIDLGAAFGSVPQTIYVAAAAYGTADGAVLSAQGPAGNGDGNIDPFEFIPLSVAAITDQDADGIYDRLEPTSGFVVNQMTRANGAKTISWNSVPGATYQVETCDQLGGTWVPLGNQITAAPGQLTLSFSDGSSYLTRFYRVRLISP
jgi:hypothetical protein